MQSLRISIPALSLGHIGAIAGVFIMLLLPVVVQDSYWLYVLTIANVYVVLALTWDVLAGYIGEVNLGHAIFFGGGAYTAGFLSPELAVPPLMSILLGGLVSAVLGAAVGFPLLRLKGPYLATTTFVLGVVAYAVANTMTEFTGGEEGIRGVESLVRGAVPNYYFSSVMVLATGAVLLALVRSDLGLIFKAIRENDAAAMAAGVDITRSKLIGWTVCAFFGGVAGAYYAHFTNVVVPDVLHITVTFTVVTVVAIGGIGTFIGPILGVYVLFLVEEFLSQWAQLRLLLYGLALAAIVLFMPQGIWGLLRNVGVTGMSRRIRQLSKAR